MAAVLTQRVTTLLVATNVFVQTVYASIMTAEVAQVYQLNRMALVQWREVFV